MRKIKLLTLLLAGLCSELPAQTYTGKVQNTNGEPIPFANVLLYSLPDSNLQTGTITDETGIFNITNKTKLLNGYLAITCIGYESFYKNLDEKLNLGNIVLNETTVELEGAEVIAHRIKRTPTGYTVNLTEDLRVKGLKMDQTLKLLPGIVWHNGIYKYNGVPIAKFYVNEQEVSLDYIKDMPSEILSKAEVSFIDQVGTSKEEGAIINLTLNKIENGGYYGRLGTTVKTRGKNYDGTTLSTIINSKINKLNIFADLRIRNNNAISNEIDNTKLFNNGIETDHINVDYDQLFKGNRFSPVLNLNYELTERQVIGLYTSANFKRTNIRKNISNKSNTDSLNFNEKQTGHSNLTQARGVISYKLNTKKEGGSLKIQAEYLHNNNDDATTFKQNDIENNETKNQNLADMYKAFTRFNYPFTENISGNLYLVWNGMRENDKQTSTGDPNNIYFTNPLKKTNIRINDPYIKGGLSWDTDNFSLTTEMAYQWSFLNYQFNDSTIKKNTQGFEPKLKMTYFFDDDEKYNISAEFDRSIYTYPYSLLNPCKIWYDRFHYTIGNQNIKPPTEISATLSTSLWYDKLYAYVGYSQVNDDYEWATFSDTSLGGNVTYTQPINASKSKSLDFGATLTLQPNDYWMFQLVAEASAYHEQAKFPEKVIDEREFRYQFYITNNFELPKDWSIYWFVYVEPTYKTYNRKYEGIYGTEIEINKIFADQFYITFLTSVGKHRKLYTYLDNEAGQHQMVQMYQNKTPLPYVELSFTWMFKGGKDFRIKKTESSIDYDKITDNKH